MYPHRGQVSGVLVSFSIWLGILFIPLDQRCRLESRGQWAALFWGKKPFGASMEA